MLLTGLLLMAWGMLGSALACGTAGLARISTVVTPAWLLERAGGSRTTATGAFAVSNQLRVFGGGSLGGLMLGLPRRRPRHRSSPTESWLDLVPIAGV
jgi:hypothetical protein